MSERHVLYGVLFTMGAMIATGWSPVASAITPTGPGLQDGNGVYLGQLLSVTSNGGNAIAYTTYLPAVNGILQFNTESGGTARFDNVVQSGVVYAQANCQGQVYVRTDQSQQFIHPWIVTTPLDMATYYKVGSSTLSIAPVSWENGGNCEPYIGEPVDVHKLNPVTLPFNATTVALPYKITP